MKTIYTNDRINAGSAGCILKLGAGYGKTYIAAYLIHKFKYKTAIILHTKSLISQWKKVIAECYPELTIGEYHSDKKIYGDVMFIIINSALSSEFTFVIKDNKIMNKETTIYKPIDFYNQFGFIIYDECHKYNNPGFSKIFKIAQAKYMLGLSATPNDMEYKALANFSIWGLGPIIDAMDIKGVESQKADFTADVHYIKYYGPAEFTKLLINEYTQTTSIASTLNMLTADPYRNSIIIKCIQDCLKLKLNVFVFSDRKEQLTYLQEQLTKKQIQNDIMIDDNAYMRLTGGASNKDLNIAVNNSSVILSTYQYMSTGISIPKMNALVMATPRKSYMEQIVKRVFRLSGDTTIKRQIYDIVDMKLTIKNQFSIRKKFYKENNYNIIIEEFKYGDIQM